MKTDRGAAPGLDGGAESVCLNGLGRAAPGEILSVAELNSVIYGAKCFIWLCDLNWARRGAAPPPRSEDTDRKR